MQQRVVQTQGATADARSPHGYRNKMCIPAAAQNERWLERGRRVTRHAGKQGKLLEAIASGEKLEAFQV